MLTCCAENRVRPVVDAVYDLARLSEAMRLLESGRLFGKIGLNVL
jgi:NADPH:quinone reductase-like Zn-dependent oxidoreductase